MKKEIWKTLKNYPQYQVSDKGRIRNNKTRIILKTGRNHKGRIIRDAHKGKRLYVVDLVKSEFKNYQPIDEREEGLDGEIWVHMSSIGYGYNQISNKGRVRKYYSREIVKGTPTDIGTVFMLENHNNNRYNKILLSDLMTRMFPDISHDDYLENDLLKEPIPDPGYKSIKVKCPLALPNEKWRMLLRYPDYMISNTGRVYGPKGKILKLTLSLNYYIASVLMYTGERKRIAVHQLVIWAFKPRIEGMTVDHIDRNSKNNHIDNLRYATRSEQNYNQNPQQSKRVYQVARIKNNKIIKIWNNREGAANELGISLSYLSNIIVQKLQYKNYFYQRYYESIKDEEWRSCKTRKFNGWYVSSAGRVKTLHKNITTGTYVMGYKAVFNNGKRTLVHRLVADAFLLKEDHHTCVDHINEDRADNRVENLRWVTRSENSRYSVESRAKKGLICKPCIQYTLDGKKIQSFSSIQEASKSTKINSNSIGKSILTQKPNNGFIWKHEKITD